MTTLKNKLILAAVSTFSLAILSTSAHAASFASNDAENLTQCSTLVKSQVGEVESIKAAGIKSKARSFTVKYKINDNGERSVVQCKLAKGKAPAVSCVKGSACAAIQTASTQK